MQKILFVDGDGTIRQPHGGEKFPRYPRDQMIIPGADQAIAHYHAQGWKIIGISNQGGVAAGYKSLESAIAEQLYTLDLFPQIEAIYFCAEFEGNECWRVGRATGYRCQLKPQNIHPNEDDWGDSKFRLFPTAIPRSSEGSYRKPGPGMIQLALNHADYFPPYKQRHDLNSHWMIGDRPEDEQAAAAAGINFCPAAVWRDRFLPGMHQHPVTRAQLEFLEGVNLHTGC